MDDLIVTIYRQSKELLVEIRRSDSDKDAQDFMDDLKSMTKSIAEGKINPRENWKEKFHISQKKETLDQLVSKYYEVALYQAVYVSILYEYNINLIEANDNGRVKEEKIKEKGREMLTAFECANRYWAAFHILNKVREKDYYKRSQKAHQAKRAKEEESFVLLRALVRSQLKQRPAKGWPNLVDTATKIADNLIVIIQDHNLPLPNDRDILMDSIHQLIFNNKSVLADYLENADNKIKLAKMSKTRVTVSRS